MKIASGLIAAGFVAMSLAAVPAGAASLLGGLITTGSDTGNGSGLISTNSDGSIGVGGTDGAAVNLGGVTGGLGSGLLGGSGSGGLLGGGSGLGSGSAGVPGVAEVSTGSDGGGTSVGATLLGGGGNTLGLNPLGLLGDSGGLNVTLPGLGGISGGPGTPGTPGEPGTPGLNGGAGFNGPSGYPGINGNNGSFYIGPDVSSRLRSILAMLAARNWIRLVDGRAICLGRFGTAEVSSLLPGKDWAGLNAALPHYAQDISTLRQMLANCRSPQQRQALDVRDLNRVIGIDVGQDGRPVVYLL